MQLVSLRAQIGKDLDRVREEDLAGWKGVKEGLPHSSREGFIADLEIKQGQPHTFPAQLIHFYIAVPVALPQFIVMKDILPVKKVKVRYAPLSKAQIMMEFLQGLPAVGFKIPERMVEVEEKVFILHSDRNLAIMNCIITGASRGLGLAMAERFAAGGYDLYLCSRDPAKLASAATELSVRYPAVDIKYFPADLSDKAQVDAFARRVAAAGADILINNAGQFIPGSVHDEPEGALESMIAINLYSAYHLTRHLLPAMMARRSGHIFNICSIASIKAYPNGGAYSISKYALAGFSANLREEMKPYGIKVTSVYPGAVYTDSWAGSGIDPQRIMTAADVAEMVFTASRLSPQATVEEILMRPQLGDL